MKFSSYIKILRPTQWLKNLMLFFPPFLGGAILQEGMLEKGYIPFITFCLASSSSYILNDILDAKRDALHPVKKYRPICSGQISRSQAFVTSGLLVLSAIIISFSVSRIFATLLLAYVLISVSYSLLLKELAVIDFFSISAGFVLRLQAGGEAFGVVISEWLFLSVFLLSLFLSVGKRSCEKAMLGENAGGHRKTLTSYPDGFLDGTLYLTGAAALVTYTMYSLPRYPLVYTVPLCTFGLLRYILRVKSGLGGDPTESLLKDVSLLVTGLIWTLLVGWSIYK